MSLYSYSHDPPVIQLDDMVLNCAEATITHTRNRISYQLRFFLKSFSNAERLQRFFRERRNLPFRIQGSPFEREDEVIIETYEFRKTAPDIYEGILRLVSQYQEQIQWVKISKYDDKYPHKCYNCGQSVYYLHAYSEFTKKEYKGPYKIREYEKEFKKIWKSQYVKFLCCDCFRIKESIDIEKI